ncbi:hypothetical protein F4814DRAFT_447927 [Daldinia grandis]|nr:hypothetical protein F4814DRAFT_447927 [Daldinia grandis]
MMVDCQNELDQVTGLDDNTNVAINLQVQADQKPKTGVAASSFPKFNSLPWHIQCMIWKRARDDRGVKHVVLTDDLCITRPVPALAHACRMARQVAFDNGRVFELGNGSKTWFSPATDFVYLHSEKFNLGELTLMVQNLIIPAAANREFNQAAKTFEGLLAPCHPRRLENIFVALELAPVSNVWSEMAITQLFGSSTVIAPALSLLDPLEDNVKAAFPVLPGTVVKMWKQYTAIPFHESMEWSECAGDVLYAWIHTAGWFSKRFGKHKFAEFENMTLKRRDGCSWWEWFENRAPDVFPTVVFMRPDKDEITMASC